MISISATPSWRILSLWLKFSVAEKFELFFPAILLFCNDIYVGISIGNWSMWKIEIKEMADTAILCIAEIFSAKMSSWSFLNFIALGLGSGSIEKIMSEKNWIQVKNDPILGAKIQLFLIQSKASWMFAAKIIFKCWILVDKNSSYIFWAYRLPIDPSTAPFLARSTASRLSTKSRSSLGCLILNMVTAKLRTDEIFSMLSLANISMRFSTLSLKVLELGTGSNGTSVSFLQPPFSLAAEGHRFSEAIILVSWWFFF